MKNGKNLQSVEKALNELFKKYGVQKKVTVEDIKNWVFNSTGPVMEASNKFHKKCLNIFPPTDDIDEMNEIMQKFVDAWNFFPHKALQGKSPDEMYREIYGEKMNNPSLKPKKEEKKPKVRVGDREMEWDEFQAMIKTMEKAQEPFKKWIERDALPKYKKYLTQIIKIKKACEEHFDVANLFFQRALHLGFVDLKSIRPAFIHSEFPKWWPTHVMYSDLKPSEVKQSLKLLYKFIELVYGVKY